MSLKKPCLAAALAATLVASSAAESPPLEPVGSLDLTRYTGTWYQVALFPNRFQAQCVADTSATYRALPDGTVEVLNRCRQSDGTMDDVLGQACTDESTIDGTRLAPARLKVSFLPAWLRWTGIGWGRYWVVQLADDYRYAVISEPSRAYLWVLARRPSLSAEDDAAVRRTLAAQGFDLARLQVHPHSTLAPSRAASGSPR